MPLYLVGYDLKEGEDYSSLTDALRAFGTYWHHLDSTWIIKSSKTAEQIRDELWSHMHSDDELLVLHYQTSDEGGSAAWNGFAPSGSKWLKARL